MNIDPELREVAELLKGRGSGPIDVASTRAGLVAMVGQPTADERVEVSEHSAKGRSGDPPVGWWSSRHEGGPHRLPRWCICTAEGSSSVLPRPSGT